VGVAKVLYTSLSPLLLVVPGAPLYSYLRICVKLSNNVWSARYSLRTHACHSKWILPLLGTTQ